MLSPENVLTRAARDGSIDPTQWPAVLKVVLDRLDHVGPASRPEWDNADYQIPQNVYNQFSMPAEATTLVAAVSRPELSTTAPDNRGYSTPAKAQDLPPSSPPEAIGGSPVSLESTPHPLPVPLATTFNFIRKSLTQNFAENPPHTIQRLSELILWPRQHHAYLHSYLNALDRVVAVSSGTNSFPLPAIERSGTATSANMVNGGADRGVNALHSDESLGGALLTPIPWLKDRETPSEGTPSPTTSRARDHFGSSTEEDKGADATMVEMGKEGVTQGELLRREQAISEPPAPVTSSASASGTLSKGYSDSILGPPPDEASEVHEREAHSREPTEETLQNPEQPHARGPEQIGMADTGPQEHVPGMGQVLDMEAAAGRSSHGHQTSLSSEMRMRGVDDLRAERQTSDLLQNPQSGDGDAELADADGLTDEDQRTGSDG